MRVPGKIVTGRKRRGLIPSRCTRPLRWLQSADLGVAFECAVAAFSVVVLEPGRKRGRAVVVGGENLPVGPHSVVRVRLRRSMLLAVLPEAAGPDELLPDVVLSTDV